MKRLSTTVLKTVLSILTYAQMYSMQETTVSSAVTELVEECGCCISEHCVFLCFSLGNSCSLSAKFYLPKDKMFH